MDEQKETVTSIDPKTGKSTEVNVVLDHVGSDGMAYKIEEAETNHNDNQRNNR